MESVVITGASRGIGEAVARRLARADRQLFLLARSGDALERIAGGIRQRGGHALPVEVDLTSPHRVAKVAGVLQAAGPVDTIILNAGVSNDVAFEDSRLEHIERELRVNYLAPLALLRELLPGMVGRGSGRVVAVASLTSFVPFPGNATYAASKAALLEFLRSVSIELRPKGIQVGVVLPGLTHSALTHGKFSLLPRMTPETVARAVESTLEEGTALRVPGLLNRGVGALCRVFPRTMDRLIIPVAPWLVPGYREVLEGR